MMQNQTYPVNSKLRLSGVLISLGLIVQAMSLLWNHPLSFIAFITVGGFLLAAGILVYLLTLVNIPSTRTGEATSGNAKAQTPQT